MSIAPYPASAIHVKDEPFTLVSFDRETAPLVASWVRDAHELFWLAPKTPAPLTAPQPPATVSQSGELEHLLAEWLGADGN